MPLARASSTLKRTCILMFCCDWSLPENDEFLNKRSGQFWDIIGNLVLQRCKLLQRSHYLCWNEVSSQTGDCGAYRPCLLLTEVIVSIRNPRCLNTDLSRHLLFTTQDSTISIIAENIFICPPVPLSFWGPKSTLVFVVFLVFERILN